MSPAEQVIATLTAHGWKREPPLRTTSDARLTYRGRAEIDHRPGGPALWLWLLGPGDKRCLGLEYGGALEAVLAKLVALQDRLVMDGYLGLYGELGEACTVAIIAWEQFDDELLAPQAGASPWASPAKKAWT